MKTITLKTPLKLQRQDLNAACASQVTLTFAFSTALMLTSSAHFWKCSRRDTTIFRGSKDNCLNYCFGMPPYSFVLRWKEAAPSAITHWIMDVRPYFPDNAKPAQRQMQSLCYYAQAQVSFFCICTLPQDNRAHKPKKSAEILKSLELLLNILIYKTLTQVLE